MKFFYSFIISFFIVISLFGQTVTIENQSFLCDDQPKNLIYRESILLSNIEYEACNVLKPQILSSIITSSTSIDIQGESDFMAGEYNNISLFIATIDLGNYIKSENTLSMDYIPVTIDVKVLYTEEYLDNVPLNYSIYKYKGDNTVYACNNQIFTVNRGDNYIVIPLLTLPVGLYVLEIQDQKGVSSYIKFKKL